MSNYVWPNTLPQAVQEDFAETNGVLILRTPMDRGPAKIRRVGARPDTMTISLQMTSAQIGNLRTFVMDTIRGVAPFTFPHPRTAAWVDVRIVPDSEGALYKIRHAAADQWMVEMVLEVLP
ncbi:conserved hypothetical protein [Gammaproteobacteria bacterium]